MKNISTQAVATRFFLVLLMGAGPLTVAPALAGGIPVVDTFAKIQLFSDFEELKDIKEKSSDAKQKIIEFFEKADALADYQKQPSGLEGFLDNFHDISFYSRSPCISVECVADRRNMIEKSRTLASESQKKANDALFKGIDQQKTELTTDANNLTSLEDNANSGVGDKALMRYANILAAHQTSQLMKIRALLLAQLNATAMRFQAEADRTAQEQAASKALRKSEIVFDEDSNTWFKGVMRK